MTPRLQQDFRHRGSEMQLHACIAPSRFHNCKRSAIGADGYPPLFIRIRDTMRTGLLTSAHLSLQSGCEVAAVSLLVSRCCAAAVPPRVASACIIAAAGACGAWGACRRGSAAARATCSGAACKCTRDRGGPRARCRCRSVGLRLERGIIYVKILEDDKECG